MHINELCLREIIEKTIGERKCKTKLQGNIGERLSEVTDLPSTEEIRIVETAEIIEINDEILADLSTDQKYAYLIYKLIVTALKRRFSE